MNFSYTSYFLGYIRCENDTILTINSTPFYLFSKHYVA